jgi:hypothetical protein
MKGYRTLLINGLLAGGAAVLQFVVGFDFAANGFGAEAAIIVAVANIGLRFLTTTPVGQK